MVCGAHNLQLAAKDVSKEYNEKIKSARVLSQELNKSKYQRLIRQHNIGMMRTDIQPRWDSTYIMLDDLNKNMQKIKGINDPNLDLTDDVWLFIQEYVTAFLPVHIAMKEFQKTNLTMSDFYCKWISMQVQVTNTPDGINSISSRLKTAIINRARKFFESDAFVAALLLDPRFTWCGRNSVYDETLRDRGIVQCEKIHHSLNRLVMNPEQIPQYHTIDNNDFLAEESVLLGGGDQDDTEIDAQNQVLTIKQMIMKFLAEPRITSTERNRFNVLEYWHSKRDKSEWKVLYNISQVVYGAAFSQVKVERDFSGFALVLNHLRSKMSDDTLNAIMVIKYNLDLLQHVNFN
ncbi:hypothetical protein PVAND_004168 [Polypedilum vanderplanki]|uniref:HAT C-terminal dimerisation domain-containing protein n=1 Tax=Polypedilum vanderplanki TaxID=319348 RepID=A0A9J6BW71_POLVA|nr:hypothetical protein PVAND_004168 [Polypedilum vanderplanki]